jgi:AraC-like DNA-binding protein
MPSSIFRRFTDPDDFAAATRATRAEITVMQRGVFAAELVRIDLHRLWLQRLHDNLGRVAHMANLKGRAIILFRTQSGPSLVRNGSEVGGATLLRCSDGQVSYQRSAGATSWGSMSLPIEDMAQLGAEVAGADLAPPVQEQMVVPATAALVKLQRLHAAAGCLAERAPEAIMHPEAVRGLEQELVAAMVACLSSAAVQTNTAASRRHYTVMRRFRSMLEANPDRAIHLPELCSAIGVSDRTLRVCCQEQLGMGPQRYLWLRRMNLARRALTKADGRTTTVTEMATAQGFWELGRFSVDYRALFGEPPSTTLHRPAADPR